MILAIMVAVPFALIAGAGAAPRVPDEVRSQRFVLVDSNGVQRGFWGQGNPSGRLHEEREGQTVLSIADDRGRTRVLFSLGAGGAPRLALFDESGIRAAMDVLYGGSPSFLLYGDRGLQVELRWAGLLVRDANGTKRVQIGGPFPFAADPPLRDASMTLFDKHENVVWKAP